jgi:cobaltochelatase CobS
VPEDIKMEPMSASFDITQLAGAHKYTSIPDAAYDVRKTFGLNVDWSVPGFATDHPNIPDIDKTYRFDHDTTMAILAGFAHNRRVMGKSTHIEQVAARLKWPCVRINLDSHVSRLDLLGKDMIVLKEGKQITEYKQGLLPWALQNPVALVFDEYDAGRPDVMFVIQRVLENEGRLTLLDQNMVIRPHPAFRLFATANTIGLGDTSGLYHGTHQINQGQMDRWNIVTRLNYLAPEQEEAIVLAKIPALDTEAGRKDIAAMVKMANLSRAGFKAGDLSTVMSPRTVITWAENMLIFGNRDTAFRMTFLNKSDEPEHGILNEYYQRCFAVDLLK